MNPHKLAEKMLDPDQGYCPPELAERIRAERAVIVAAKALFGPDRIGDLEYDWREYEALHQAVDALESAEASAP